MNEHLAKSLLALRQLEQNRFHHSRPAHPGTSVGSWWIGRSKNNPYRHVVEELSKIGITRVPPPIVLLLISAWQSNSISLRADAVFFKTHARAFYLDKGRTVKFAGAHDRIRNELAMRSSVRSTNSIVVPCIYESDDGETPFIVEELIFGGSRTMDADMTAEFATTLWEFYESNGIAPVPLSQIIDQSDLAANLEPALNFMRAKRDPVMRAWDSICRGLYWDCPVPVGLCHGDLSDSNMLIKNRKLVLLDWENAHRGLIFDDLAKLNTKFVGISDLIAEPYGHWCAVTRSAVLSVPLLLSLCLMWSFVTHWKEISGSSPTRKLAHRLSRLQSAIARI